MSRNKIKILIFSVCVELSYSLFYSLLQKYAREPWNCFYRPSLYSLIRTLVAQEDVYKVMQYLEGIKYFHLFTLCTISRTYERVHPLVESSSFSFLSLLFFLPRFYELYYFLN